MFLIHRNISQKSLHWL